jgi:hypothetical protein
VYIWGDKNEETGNFDKVEEDDNCSDEYLISMIAWMTELGTAVRV